MRLIFFNCAQKTKEKKFEKVVFLPENAKVNFIIQKEIIMQNPYIAAAVDFTQDAGKLNPALHSSNSCPPLYGRGFAANNVMDELFKQMNFHSSRNHDWALWNSGQRMVDTLFIFPLMHLDPKDEKNYYFGPTDAIIKICREKAGMNVFYRLGTSIEHNPDDQHFNTLVPEDFDKYAEVLAGIVRHYTRGWANGFEYKDMIYWEIWNEPDLPYKMWCGTEEEFIRLYVTVLKRLKSEFPELKIGGPACCVLKMDFVHQLLDACKAAGIAPDFFSWHKYTSNADALIAEPAMIRKLLDEKGFTKTETCINEWHYLISWDGVQSSASTDMRRRAMEGVCGLHGIDSGCFNLAVLSGWQYEPLDSGFYYGAAPFNVWGFYDEFRKLSKNFYSMVLFGKFLQECERKVTVQRFYKTVYAVAAHGKDGKSASMLITDYQGANPTLEIEVKGMENAQNIYAVILDKDRDIIPVPVVWRNNRLLLNKGAHGSASFYVTFEF